MPLLKRLFNLLLTPLIALILIFEEWGWEPLAHLMSRLARLPLWGAFERLIMRLPPYAALATFMLPVLALFPVKLLALYWIAGGHVALGVCVVIAAKVLGTAVAARLFMLTQPALMRLAWFARLYPRFKAWKDGLFERVRSSFMWRYGRIVKHRARDAVLRRWRGARRTPASPDR